MTADRVSTIRRIVATAVGSTVADLMRPAQTPDRCVLAHVLWLDGQGMAAVAAAMGVDATKVGYMLRESKRHRERRVAAVHAYLRHAPPVVHEVASPCWESLPKLVDAPEVKP